MSWTGGPPRSRRPSPASPTPTGAPGHADVVQEPSFRDFMAAVEREDRRRQRQAKPLREVEMAAVRASAWRPRQVRGRPETEGAALRRGLVDVATLQVMRDALLRVGEAAQLLWEDIDFVADGCGLLHVRRSKTDQAGEGKVLILSPLAAEDLRRVMALGQAGPGDRIFRLSASQLGRRIRQACEHAGLGPGFSGHSPRVGMAQDLSAAGGEMPALMESGRWKSSAMVYRYTRSQEAYRSAVARYYGLAPDSAASMPAQPTMEGV